MMPPAIETEGSDGRGFSFPTTRWSLVSQAGEAEPGRADAALETLCARYWKALYGFARRNGWSHEDAEDLTQGFIAHLLAKKAVQRFERKGVKFRAFLCVAFKRFLIGEVRRRHADIRGGGAQPATLDDWEGQDLEGAPNSPPPEDHLFDKDWAMVLLNRAFDLLKQEFGARGSPRLFGLLKERLLDEVDAAYYDQAGGELGMEAAAVKTARSRMKARFKEAVRHEIADTVTTPEEIDQEINYLLRVLGQ
jgi:RNA polymerase sigma-70 factor (ECF subfamily)